MSIDSFVDPDELRSEFCSALSAMYRAEVPLYGDLVELVDAINLKQENLDESTSRLKVERHGAIRLGKACELEFISRLFRLMNMYPVGYYDLSTSGVPVHATAFRPISPTALAKNPFRVFTSLLRSELIADEALRKAACDVLVDRDIFNSTIRRLVEQAEKENGVRKDDVQNLVNSAMEVFRWHDTALVSEELYTRMKDAHPLLADIAGFKGPHINHLTPRVLDIDEAQVEMARRGITPKQLIEGPPKRLIPILLRQTSFKALTERIRFVGSKGECDGSHRARFGEIESRGTALTKKGHDLYLQIMAQAAQLPPTDDNALHQQRLTKIFTAFPDDVFMLWKEGLAHFNYVPNTQFSLSDLSDRNPSLEEMIKSGKIILDPITYEDFLPASAAGIFQSNLTENGRPETPENSVKIRTNVESAQEEFEICLGGRVIDHWEMYEQMERKSLTQLEDVLGRRLC